MFTLNITDLNDSNFDVEVVESTLPVLVDFWADWCGPCMLMAPIVDELATAWEGKIKVGKLDVDANYKTARRFGVMTIPTLMLFRGGRSVDRIVGLTAKSDIERKLKSLLSA